MISVILDWIVRLKRMLEPPENVRCVTATRFIDDHRNQTFGPNKVDIRRTSEAYLLDMAKVQCQNVTYHRTKELYTKRTVEFNGSQKARKTIPNVKVRSIKCICKLFENKTSKTPQM